MAAFRRNYFVSYRQQRRFQHKARIACRFCADREIDTDQQAVPGSWLRLALSGDIGDSVSRWSAKLIVQFAQDYRARLMAQLVLAEVITACGIRNWCRRSAAYSPGTCIACSPASLLVLYTRWW
jgi:hypothetical protein